MPRTPTKTECGQQRMMVSTCSSITFKGGLHHFTRRKTDIERERERDERELAKWVKCCITEFELSGSMYVRVLCCQVLKELCSKCDEACVNSKNRVGRTALHSLRWWVWLKLPRSCCSIKQRYSWYWTSCRQPNRRQTIKESPDERINVKLLSYVKA